jgi:hypothetical protein
MKIRITLENGVQMTLDKVAYYAVEVISDESSVVPAYDLQIPPNA